MVTVLDHQLFELCNAVFMCRRILIHYTDKGNLRPDNEAQLITGIIEILGMLVMRQPDRICSQLFDDPCILIMILPCQSIPFIQFILMPADAPQRSRDPIEDKSLVRVAGKTPDTDPRRHLIICFITSLQRRRNRIQIRIFTIP